MTNSSIIKHFGVSILFELFQEMYTFNQVKNVSKVICNFTKDFYFK